MITLVTRLQTSRIMTRTTLQGLGAAAHSRKSSSSQPPVLYKCHSQPQARWGPQHNRSSAHITSSGSCMALVVVVPLVTAFYVPTRTPLWPVAADPVPARRSAPAMVALPRNLKEVLAQLRDSVQASLRDRNSRISVETPIGFEFGVEGERVKRQGKPRCSSQVTLSAPTGARDASLLACSRHRLWCLSFYSRPQGS